MIQPLQGSMGYHLEHLGTLHQIRNSTNLLAAGKFSSFNYSSITTIAACMYNYDHQLYRIK